MTKATKKTKTVEDKREECVKELGEVLKKHGFGIQAVNPQPVINLVEVEEAPVATEEDETESK